MKYIKHQFDYSDISLVPADDLQRIFLFISYYYSKGFKGIDWMSEQCDLAENDLSKEIFYIFSDFTNNKNELLSMYEKSKELNSFCDLNPLEIFRNQVCPHKYIFYIICYVSVDWELSNASDGFPRLVTSDFIKNVNRQNIWPADHLDLFTINHDD